MNPDLINGIFEIVGGALIWWDVRCLLRDRVVHGVYWPTRLFFASWGFWNLFYYPGLGQWWSFWGGVFLVAGSSTWSLIAYRLRN